MALQPYPTENVMKKLVTRALLFGSTLFAAAHAIAGDVGPGTSNLPGPGVLGLVAAGIIGAIAVARKRK